MKITDILKEFAPGNGGGESGQWYSDDQMTDIVGDGWWQDLDISGDVSKMEMINEAQAWLLDQGYRVRVLNVRVNDDDCDWFIEGSFQNPDFAKKGLGEAGEPENPSRRGFLRGLAGAAATAAMPGGVANLVKTAPAAAPAAAAATASAADLLFQTALNIGAKHGFAKPGSMWDDEEGNEEDEWDKELEEPQGDVGEMPWGEYYEMGESPNGVPYLHTADSPDGTYAVFTFMDGGKPQYIVIEWERTGWGEVNDTSDQKYADRWYRGSDDWEGDPSEIIDILLNPEFDAVPGDRVTQTSNVASGGVTDKETKLYALMDKATGQGIGLINAVNDEEAINDFLKFAGNRNFDLKDYNLVATDGWVNGKAKNPRVVDIPASGPSPMDLARLAGIAGKAADTTKQPAAPAQAQQPAQAALPAPSAPNTLEPELDKQKQKVPVNKNASS